METGMERWKQSWSARKEKEKRVFNMDIHIPVHVLYLLALFCWHPHCVFHKCLVLVSDGDGWYCFHSNNLCVCCLEGFDEGESGCVDRDQGYLGAGFGGCHHPQMLHADVWVTPPSRQVDRHSTFHLVMSEITFHLLLNIAVYNIIIIHHSKLKKLDAM